jgi:hypothetical protein
MNSKRNVSMVHPGAIWRCERRFALGNGLTMMPGRSFKIVRMIGSDACMIRLPNVGEWIVSVTSVRENAR